MQMFWTTFLTGIAFSEFICYKIYVLAASYAKFQEMSSKNFVHSVVAGHRYLAFFVQEHVGWQSHFQVMILDSFECEGLRILTILGGGINLSCLLSE